MIWIPVFLVHVCGTLWTITHRAPLSMGFSRQEYWSGLPFLPPADLPDLGIQPASPVSPALAGGFFITAPPGTAPVSKLHAPSLPLRATQYLPKKFLF